MDAVVIDLSPKYKSVLAHNELFRGVPEEDIPQVLGHLYAHIEHFEKDEVIVPLGSKVKAGVVLEGEAKVSYFDESYVPMAMDHLYSGDTIGQMAACLEGYRSQVELTALTYTVVCRIDLSPFVGRGDKAIPRHHHTIAANVLKSVSEHAALLHLRLRIIGQKTLRNRLKVYLNHLVHEPHVPVHIPFSMSDLAAFLNSDRSALYKEIRQLKQEGVLDWTRRRVHLHEKDF